MARKQFGTLTEQMFYILLALHEPLHGYAIMHYVLELTCGRVRIGAGTLYTLLSRFDDEGYVSMRQEGGRKIYALTSEGHRLFDCERERLKTVLSDTDAALKKPNDEK